MIVTTERRSSTVTHYLITAHLGPDSVLQLVTDDGMVMAQWWTGDAAGVLRCQWVSSYPDLSVRVFGEELGDEPEARTAGDPDGDGDLDGQPAASPIS